MSTTVSERIASSRPRRLRRVFKRSVLIVAALGFLIASIDYGMKWWTVGRFIESTADAYGGGEITAIAPHIAGFVADVAVVDNQHVVAGQMPMRLDDREMRREPSLARRPTLARCPTGCS